MIFRVLCLLTITAWIEVQCYVAVPSIYQDAEKALRHYSSQRAHNPIIYSLLNVLVYDKRAKAFVTDEVIDQILEDVQKFDSEDGEILREIIYGKKSSSKSSQLTEELKDDVQSALDTFFAHDNMDDYNTFALLSNRKHLKL